MHDYGSEYSTLEYNAHPDPTGKKRINNWLRLVTNPQTAHRLPKDCLFRFCTTFDRIRYTTIWNHLCNNGSTVQLCSVKLNISDIHFSFACTLFLSIRIRCVKKVRVRFVKQSFIFQNFSEFIPLIDLEVFTGLGITKWILQK